MKDIKISISNIHDKTKTAYLRILGFGQIEFLGNKELFLTARDGLNTLFPPIIDGGEIANAIRKKCTDAGWGNVHGGREEGGMYWRGINPETKRVEKIPEDFIYQSNAEMTHPDLKP